MHSVAELVDGAVVPFVCAAWTSWAWTKVHVCHGYLIDIVCWVLRDCESPCGSCFPSDDVNERLSAGLTGASTPENRRDIGIIFRWSIV